MADYCSKKGAMRVWLGRLLIARVLIERIRKLSLHSMQIRQPVLAPFALRTSSTMRPWAHCDAVLVCTLLSRGGLVKVGCIVGSPFDWEVRMAHATPCTNKIPWTFRSVESRGYAGHGRPVSFHLS